MYSENRSVLVEAGKIFRTKNISHRVQDIVISPIKEMSILADEWQKQTADRIISFGQGIPFWDTPVVIKDKIIEAINAEADTAKYTLEPGIPQLRTLIAEKICPEKGIKNVQANGEIMVTTGGQEALACALLSILDSDDEVIIPEPAYASHIEQVKQFGGVPRFAPSLAEDNWAINLDAIEEQINEKTKAIFFSNPCNPTGYVLSERETGCLAEIAIKHDLIIVADETYDFLTYDDRLHYSMGRLKQIRDRVIVCASFSKIFALTGYRVGYAFADSGIIDHMLKVHDALTICAPAVSQKAAIAGISHLKEIQQEAKEKFTVNRAKMCTALDQLSDYFSYYRPAGAYYILAKVKFFHKNSFDLSLRILREANVIVIPGAAFGPSGERHLRFSFAGDPQDINLGFERLRHWLNKTVEK